MLRMTAKALESGRQRQGERVRGQHRAQDISLSLSFPVSVSLSWSVALKLLKIIRPVELGG